ncbi:hypothetical protein LTR17_016346 [Elasticomyces elasticus]|nr:hypothetical protein LTR17_016346 [Elasticomyces elasticus]
MEAVTDITELLENILQFLPVSSLHKAMRVSKRWRDIVLVLRRTNSLVRRRLFLEPASIEEMLELSKLECCADNIPWVYVDHESQIPAFAHRGPTKTKIVANPYLLTTTSTSDDAHLEHSLPLRPDFLEAEPNRGVRAYMFPTQPPYIEQDWCVKARDPILSIEPSARRAPLSTSCRFAMHGREKLDRGGRTIARTMEILERTGMGAGFGCEVDWTDASVYLGPVINYSEVLDGLSDVVVVDERMWRILEGISVLVDNEQHLGNHGKNLTAVRIEQCHRRTLPATILYGERLRAISVSPTRSMHFIQQRPHYTIPTRRSWSRATSVSRSLDLMIRSRYSKEQTKTHTE